VQIIQLSWCQNNPKKRGSFIQVWIRRLFRSFLAGYRIHPCHAARSMGRWQIRNVDAEVLLSFLDSRIRVPLDRFTTHDLIDGGLRDIPYRPERIQL
jgi:hypothetical protein